MKEGAAKRVPGKSFILLRHGVGIISYLVEEVPPSPASAGKDTF